MDLYAVLSLACKHAGTTTDHFFDDCRTKGGDPKAQAARVVAFTVLHRHGGVEYTTIARTLYGDGERGSPGFRAVTATLRASSVGKADRLLEDGLDSCVRAVLDDPGIDDPAFRADW